MAEIPGGVDPTQQAIQAEIKAQTSAAQQTAAMQVSVKRSFTEEAEEAFNPFSADTETEFKSLRERPREVSKEEQKELHELKVNRKEQDAEDLADQLSEENSELDRFRLREMRRFVLSRVSSSNAVEILKDVQSYFKDPSLADEALDYLLQTCEPDHEETLREAKELLNKDQGKEVRAGRNMGPDSREFAKAGLAPPEQLRNLYRDILLNPRDRNELFQELAHQYPFEKLKKVIKFLLQSLGSDLRSKGPSIARGELYRLTTETRVLQSILGVHYFFKRRERLIRKLFHQEGIPVPGEIQFELLAQKFIELVDERYPTSAKILRFGSDFGISEDLLAQVIIYSQYRDAIREVAPRIYRSLQHRYDTLQALIETLDQLEEQLDELAEEE